MDWTQTSLERSSSRVKKTPDPSGVQWNSVTRPVGSNCMAPARSPTDNPSLPEVSTCEPSGERRPRGNAVAGIPPDNGTLIGSPYRTKVIQVESGAQCGRISPRPEVTCTGTPPSTSNRQIPAVGTLRRSKRMVLPSGHASMNVMESVVRNRLRTGAPTDAGDSNEISDPPSLSRIVTMWPSAVQTGS